MSRRQRNVEIAESSDDYDQGKGDSIVKRLAILAVCGVITIGSFSAGYGLISPKHPEPVFAAIPFLDGAVVNCSEVVRRYEPDDRNDEVYAGGGAARFQGHNPGEGLRFYFEHVDAVVVHACRTYLKSHPGTSER